MLFVKDKLEERKIKTKPIVVEKIREYGYIKKILELDADN